MIVMRGGQNSKRQKAEFKLFRILKVQSEPLKNETNQNAKKSSLSDQNLER
jgi:hypothetical protein